MLIKLRHKGQLTIPDDVRRAVHLVEGDYLAVSVRDGAILLEPKTVIDSAQAWFWKADWQAGERQASEDIAIGRTTRFDSDEDFLDSLI
jgi:AbrB family looped-hinge helix DNA binding protein